MIQHPMIPCTKKGKEILVKNLDSLTVDHHMREDVMLRFIFDN